MDNASTDPRVMAIANRAVNMPTPKVDAPVVIEEAKKSIFSEEGEGGDGQSGSSAITTDTLGDYKYAGRGWMRPARDPKKKDQLPEEKNIDSDAELYKEEDEGSEWVWESEDLADRLADKLADLLSRIEDGDDDSTINGKFESIELDDDLFYEPEDDDELSDTPYTMDGVDDDSDDLGIEDDFEDDDDEETLEEQNQVVGDIVADFSTYTLTGDPIQDEFAMGLDKAMCEVIQEGIVNKAELVRRKIKAGRRMKRMASKMRSRRKQKFKRSDMKTVKSRVHKAAIKSLKDKFAKSKGGRYDDLSLSAKVDVDQMVKKRANLIPALERKMFVKYKAKLTQRRKAKPSKP